jgi:hypothetical protein
MNDEWSDDEYDDEYENYSKQSYRTIYTDIMYVHTTNYTIKHNIFVIVENIFKDEISSYLDEYINSISICYSIQNKTDVIEIGDKFQQIFPYNTLGNYDLYLTLIFIYYSLLAEPGEEIFTGSFFTRYAYNYILVTELYFVLTTGELFDNNGHNLSQIVRKYFLGII